MILLVFIRTLRESWKRIFIVVWDSLAIMVLIVANLVVWALLGYLLFSSNILYNDPEGYFADIPTTIFNVYVLFTTSNFPDILFPFWKVNNLAAVYFVSFLLIGLYLLLNLMLAVFYNSYKQQIEKKISKYDELRAKFLEDEFKKINKAEDRDFVTVDEFKYQYTHKVIDQSEKVKTILNQISNEMELGLSDGRIDQEDFAYLYMFLEFGEGKKLPTKTPKKSHTKI